MLYFLIKMSVASIILLILGILMLIEGGIVIFFPKFSIGIFRKFVKNMRRWGIVEVIIALALIIISLRI